MPSTHACQLTHLFLAHSGLKWMVRQILPPLYILAVLPSSSGSSISGATAERFGSVWDGMGWVVCEDQQASRLVLRKCFKLHITAAALRSSLVGATAHPQTRLATNLNPRPTCWVGRGHIKLEIKLVLDVIVDVPAWKRPVRKAG